MTENTQKKPKKEKRPNPFVKVDDKTFLNGDVQTEVYLNVWKEMGVSRLRMTQRRRYTHAGEDGLAESFGPEDLDNMIRGIWQAKEWMRTRQRRFRLSDLFALFK
jgi:hypothetical protein